VLEKHGKGKIKNFITYLFKFMIKLPLFLSIIIFLLSSIFLITCAKEYSYEGGPLAQYTIEGSPKTCTPAILSGNYIAGLSVDSSNYLQVTADVTIPGYYKIFTVPVDGISFSASGNFTDTGKHVIKLSCSGIPDSAGTFTIKISGNNGCFITLKINNKNPASYFLYGNPGDCSNPVTKGKYIQYKKVTTDETIVLNVNVTAPGTYKIKTDITNGISFSASGFFSKIGNQTVTLTSVGIPDQPGRFFFNVQADSTQCNFSIPVEPMEPQAIYVLEFPYDTICLSTTVKGNYIAGTQLNNTNTVSFSVYVTYIGNYSIYTNKANGIMFKTSGKFSVLGQQTVILTGSGVPSASGTYVFTPAINGPAPLGGVYCNYSIQIQ
jgi:hypothetical protein